MSWAQWVGLIGWAQWVGLDKLDLMGWAQLAGQDGGKMELAKQVG